MRLADFRIKNYKVVADTDPVRVDPCVTALVGNNEAGKTAVLQAMWKSRNVAGARFDKLFDYPRDRYLQDRRGTQEITVLRFELSPGESDDFVAQLPQSPPTKPTQIVHTTFYDGENGVRRTIQFDCDLAAGASLPEARASIESITTAIASEEEDDLELVLSVSATSLAQVDASTSIWAQAPISALETFAAAVNTWIEADPERDPVASDERRRLAELIARIKLGDPRGKAGEWAEKHLPVFIYFEEFGQLGTRIHLPTYLQRKDSPDPETRTQAALFDWSGIDPAEILSLGLPRRDGESGRQFRHRHEKRRAILDSASFVLSGEWVSWWTEKRHRLHFDLEGEHLVLKVSDDYNASPILFEERGRGFQWLFSFYLVFLVESRKTHKAAILLLDEPGLHLHPTLQTKLIDLFEHISDENQLIYSTHLPFLVDVHHLERVRTIQLDGPVPKRTRISDDLCPTGNRDTLLPVQAAVAYTLAEALRLGPRSVIVGEIVDYWILRALGHCLSRLDIGPGLHEETTFVPAGGASLLMPLASLMLASAGPDGGHLLVLLGGARRGEDGAPRMRNVFRESSVMLLGDLLDADGASIEDLVPRTTYAEAVARTGYDVALRKDEKGVPTNVTAMELAFRRKGLGEFGIAQRAAAALRLVESWSRNPKTVPRSTRQKTSALFEAINAHFHRRS